MIQAFLFEAQQIQSYIFSTNKLRDASGASELINSICSEDVSGPVVSKKGLGPGAVGAVFDGARIFRSTGGVLDFAVDATPDEMARFRAVFRLAVTRCAPGLAFSDGVGEGADESVARKAARADSLVSQPVGGGAPFVSPLIRPAPRSGGVPAVLRGWTGATGNCVITGEFADLATLAKRQFLDRDHHDLADTFLPPAYHGTGLKWPEVFSTDEEKPGDRPSPKASAVFPFAGKDVKRIALIHADGNGVGRLFMEADKTLSPDRMRDLSRALAGAMRAAVQVAMGPVADAAVGGIVPARPILLGGDDVTLILRADLAVDFVTALIEAFQTQATAAVRKYLPQQPPLTLKAGVVILGPAQPFGQAHSLCGVLAGLAKAEISRVSLWRLTTSVMPRGKDDLDLQARCDDGRARLWKPAHAVADLRALQTLAGLMAEDDVGRGALRRVPELLNTDRAGAERTFKRAMVVLTRRNGDIAARVRAALDMFGAGETGIGTGGYCPLLDAHDLAQVMPAPKAGAQP